jgi:hypothetical protein
MDDHAGCALLCVSPLLLLAVLSLATTRVGSVPVHVVLAAAFVVAVVAWLLARRRR